MKKILSLLMFACVLQAQAQFNFSDCAVRVLGTSSGGFLYEYDVLPGKTTENNGVTYTEMGVFGRSYRDYLAVSTPKAPSYVRTLLVRESDGVTYRYEEDKGEESVVSDVSSLSGGLLRQGDIPGTTLTDVICVGTYDYQPLTNERVQVQVFKPEQLSRSSWGLDFSFCGDTLCIFGIYSINGYPYDYHAAICAIESDHVYIDFQPTKETSSGKYAPMDDYFYRYDLKFPGFAKGTYHIHAAAPWMKDPSQRDVMLECAGKKDGNETFITDLNTSGLTPSSTLYDLQGRRLTTDPQHGMFIKDGKKVVK